MRTALGCALASVIVVGLVTPVRADRQRNSAAVEAALPPVRAALETCAMKQSFIGTVRVTLDVRADGGVTSVEIPDTASELPPKLADCLRGPLERVRLPKGAAARATHLLKLGDGADGRSHMDGRDRRAIDAALDKQRESLVVCATRAGFKGRVPVRLGVRANGQIVSAKFHDDTSPNFARCLSKALTRLRLAKGPTDTTVEHTLSLIPAAAAREPDSIKRLLQEYSDKIDACGTKATFTGTVELTLGIRDNGSVASLATPKGTGTLLTSCLRALFKTVDFGPSAKGSTLKYTLAIPFGAIARDEASVTSALASVHDGIAACAKAVPDHPATLSVTLTVRAEGTVASAIFADGAPGDLTTCLSPILTGLRLPRASTASELTYELPL
jgi:hypothetical protein